MTGRLHLRLYLALLASSFVCLLAVAVGFRLLAEVGGSPVERLRQSAAVATQAIEETPLPELRARVDALGRELGVDLAVWDARSEGRRPIAASATPRPLAPPHRRAVLEEAWGHDPAGLALYVPMRDGGVLGVRLHRRLPPHNPFFFGLGLLAIVMAIGSYPVARRLARRIEALASGVERWGRGDLAHRVPVDGRDEIATLAATFNKAAAQIDELVVQQRQTLANASHELRSPLARLRMALELIAEEPSPDARAAQLEAARGDVEDLDALIEDLLLLARADARTPRRPLEPVELRALAHAEAARSPAAISGPEVTISGDPMLLKHLIRNLVENAHRHAGGREVRVAIEPTATQVVLAVEDRGPGVPEADRERVFAPFYRGARTGSADAREGVGLGLAVVRQIARYHGGDARVLARPGGGSRFEVTLPRHVAAS